MYSLNNNNSVAMSQIKYKTIIPKPLPNYNYFTQTIPKSPNNVEILENSVWIKYNKNDNQNSNNLTENNQLNTDNSASETQINNTTPVKRKSKKTYISRNKRKYLRLSKGLCPNDVLRLNYVSDDIKRFCRDKVINFRNNSLGNLDINEKYRVQALVIELKSVLNILEQLNYEC